MRELLANNPNMVRPVWNVSRDNPGQLGKGGRSSASPPVMVTLRKHQLALAMGALRSPEIVGK